MKFLYDQNLSFRLVDELSETYPDSSHVRLEGLGASTDTEIWEYAKTHGYIIVSKDSDFHQRSLTVGAPPKVVWVQRGNCTTDEIIRLLRSHRADIQEFVDSPEATFLELS